MVAVYVQVGITFPHHGLSYQMRSQRYMRLMCSQHTQADSPLALLSEKHPSALPLEPDSDSRPTGGPTPVEVVCHRQGSSPHPSCRRNPFYCLDTAFSCLQFLKSSTFSFCFDSLASEICKENPGQTDDKSEGQPRLIHGDSMQRVCNEEEPKALTKMD